MFPETYTAIIYAPGAASVRTMQQAIDRMFSPSNTNTPAGVYPENGWRTAPTGGNILNAT